MRQKKSKNSPQRRRSTLTKSTAKMNTMRSTGLNRKITREMKMT
jgi:hypothetical protein